MMGWGWLVGFDEALLLAGPPPYPEPGPPRGVVVLLLLLCQLPVRRCLVVVCPSGALVCGVRGFPAQCVRCPAARCHLPGPSFGVGRPRLRLCFMLSQSSCASLLLQVPRCACCGGLKASKGNTVCRWENSKPRSRRVARRLAVSTRSLLGSTCSAIASLSCRRSWMGFARRKTWGL